MNKGTARHLSATRESWARRVVLATIHVLNRYWPKDPNRSLILTFPDLDDQGLALIDELLDRQSYVTWMLRDASLDSSLLGTRLQNQGVKFIRFRSFRSIIEFLRSGYIWHTHGIFGNRKPPANQVVVNLWHGMPIKKMGVSLGASPTYATWNIATSEAFVPRISEWTGMPPESVLITGLPRNDIMLRSAEKLPSRSSAMQKARAKGFIIWMPTWRPGSSQSSPQLDLSPAAHVVPSDEQLGRLGSLLLSHNLELGIRIHPQSARRSLEGIPGVFNVDDLSLRHGQLSLYEVIGASSGMITDYSSVWIDYLLVDKPLIFFIPDSDQYKHDRGFYLWSHQEDLPGWVVTDFEDLISVSVHVSDKHDDFGELRKIWKSRCHTGADLSATQRIMRNIFGSADARQSS